MKSYRVFYQYISLRFLQPCPKHCLPVSLRGKTIFSTFSFFKHCPCPSNNNGPVLWFPPEDVFLEWRQFILGGKTIFSTFSFFKHHPCPPKIMVQSYDFPQKMFFLSGGGRLQCEDGPLLMRLLSDRVMLLRSIPSFISSLCLTVTCTTNHKHQFQSLLPPAHATISYNTTC